MNVIPPGMDSGVFPAHKHGVKEYIVVLQGKLRAHLTQGDMIYELNEGDSIYFEADIEHRFVNAGIVECRYCVVIDSYGMK